MLHDDNGYKQMMIMVINKKKKIFNKNMLKRNKKVRKI